MKIPQPSRAILDDTDDGRKELLRWINDIVAALKTLDARIAALEQRSTP